MTGYARRVLDVVDAIPAGRVLSYGDVAECLAAGSPRSVGRILARYGHEVPWHRVVMADGRPAPGKERRQLGLLLRDRTPVVTLPSGEVRVLMPAARWADPPPL